MVCYGPMDTRAAHKVTTCVWQLSHQDTLHM